VFYYRPIEGGSSTVKSTRRGPLAGREKDSWFKARQSGALPYASVPTPLHRIVRSCSLSTKAQNAKLSKRHTGGKRPSSI